MYYTIFQLCFYLLEFDVEPSFRSYLFGYVLTEFYTSGFYLSEF